MKKYSVVFATDENYIQHLSVALFSLLKNNNNCQFQIYVICSGISEKYFHKLKLIVNKFDSTINQIVVKDEIFDSLVTNHHFTKAMYYRLLIPKFIKDDVVLYLDADIVVNGSIKDLFDIDLESKYIGAVLNPGFQRHKELKMDLDSEYFNSGVMLINNKLWITNSVADKVIKFVDDNQSVIKFPDQCGLNAIVNGNWQKAPLKFNQQAAIFEKDFSNKYNCFSKEELEDAKENPIIIHYTGSSKPWHFRNKHPYKNLYWKYLKMTPFKRYIPNDLTVVNVIKWMIPKSIKEFIKGFI